jgi:DedD protein
MQIKGEEFIKKVQLQQERDELEKKLSELEEVESTMSEEAVVVDESIQSNEHELNNIMLESSGSNEDNKKKYLILGIILVILFLLTIIIIRLLTDDSSKEDPFTSKQAESSEMKKIEENSNIEENFQKIINDRIKKDAQTEDTQNSTTTQATSEEKIEALPKDEIKEEAKVETKNETTAISNDILDETIKKIEEKTNVVKEKVTPKKQVVVKEKVEPKKTIKSLVENSSNSISKGYFVQVGAFTKKPSDSYINTIRNAKLKYKIYQVEVKGTMYNKVLIGPYSSRASANENIDSIKNKLNISNAYILKF